jgi:hypothetical protein
MAGDRVSVDPGGLLLLADRLSATGATLATGPLTGGGHDACGDPGLAAALAEFDRVWGRVWSELDDDLGRLADGLRLLATAYQEVEAGSVSSFDRLRDWLTG